jgi:hypothetical protein
MPRDESAPFAAGRGGYELVGSDRLSAGRGGYELVGSDRLSESIKEGATSAVFWPPSAK